MKINVSPDGETWYECPPERFSKMLADESFDCWVDLSSEETGLQHVTLSTVRKMIADGLVAGQLYGLPIVYDRGKE